MIQSDGRHYLFEMGSGRRTAGGGVYFASLDSPQATRLVEGASAPAFAPSAPESELGHLLFMREATLLAQRFDAARRQLSGDPFPVAEQVNQRVLVGAAPYSVSTNGALVWRTGRSGGESQLLWFDREGRSQPASPPGVYRDVSLSPDGKQVAVSEGEAPTGDIWLLEWARGPASPSTPLRIPMRSGLLTPAVSLSSPRAAAGPTFTGRPRAAPARTSFCSSRTP